MFSFFFSSRRRHTRCALVTGVQTCALPIYQERGLVLAVEHDVIAKRAEVRDTEWPERGIVESRRLRQIAGTETCVRKYTITGNNCHNNSPLLEIIEFFFESLSETACTT